MSHIPYFIAGWGVFRFITSHEKLNILIIFLGFLGLVGFCGAFIKFLDWAENKRWEATQPKPNKSKQSVQTKKYSQINEAINDLLTPECFIDLSNSQKQCVLDSLGNEDKLHNLTKLKEAIS